MKGFKFCSECGFKLQPSDKFCPNCGVKLGYSDFELIDDDDFFLKYKIKIENLSKEYDSKVNNAIELINKHFKPSERSFNNFISTINDSNNVFYNNVEVALSIIDLSDGASTKIKKELDDKIHTLNGIIDKLEEFIDELIINLSDRSKNEVENLTKELDSLIDSVKDY